MSTRIAVVGAGVAGLTAARALRETGASVLVLDKARGPGGRISTRRATPYAFDHGAQYLTARDPSFQKQVDDWCARGVAARWDGRIAALDAGVVRDAGKNDARYVGVPGMSALARDLAAPLEVVCGERIASAERGASWRLTAESGSVLEGFDALVLATPAPQAAPLAAAVPGIAERVAAVAMQPCHAAMAVFERPLDVDFIGAFVASSPLAWVAHDAAKPGRGEGECWVLHTTPDWSASHLDDAPDAVAAALVSAFGEALGTDLPATRHLVAHRWLFARCEEGLGEPYLWDAERGLGVCGDWTFGGRVENAFLSGARLADAMSGALRSRG